jgi:hypothetical protein
MGLTNGLRFRRPWDDYGNPLTDTQLKGQAIGQTANRKQKKVNKQMAKLDKLLQELLETAEKTSQGSEEWKVYYNLKGSPEGTALIKARENLQTVRKEFFDAELALSSLNHKLATAEHAVDTLASVDIKIKVTLSTV